MGMFFVANGRNLYKIPGGWLIFSTFAIEMIYLLHPYNIIRSFMTKKGLLIAVGLMSVLSLGTNTLKAQTQDVSITVSPYVSYNWWNENIALKNSPFYGARVGFGFGPFFEIRANAEKSLNLKTAIGKTSWNPFNEETLNKIDGMDTDITRFGGEVKINLLNGYSVAPYITGGAGVQILNYNPFDYNSADGALQDARLKESQLYWTAGLGLKVNFSPRIALALEGRNVRFNMDANNSLINPAHKTEASKWGNWQAAASLDFYLGGNPTMEGPNGRVYQSLYSDGFQGMKFVIEPGIQYIDFNEKLAGLEDQWFMGGAVGLDFSSLIGLRAYYYQATEQPDKLDFNFNKDYRMYGLDLLARLNYPRGIVPYLQFGAGYLDQNNLILSTNTEEAKEAFKSHNLFAKLGAGVEIPVSRWFAFYGSVNGLLMTDRLAGVELKEISAPSQIVVSPSYTAGLRINIGNPATMNDLYYPTASATTVDPVTGEVLNGDINDARTRYTRDNLFGRDVYVNAKNMMTKQEFEDMVDRILEKIRSEESARASLFTQDEMDVVLTAINAQNAQRGLAPVSADASKDQIIADLRARVNALERQNNGVAPSTTIIAPGTGYTAPVAPAVAAPVAPGSEAAVPAQRIDPNVYTNPSAAALSPARTGYLKLNRLAVFTGVNLGEGTQWQLGARGYLQISDTNLDFVPEVAVGVGSKTGFDLSANVIYNFRLSDFVLDPYVGAGLGFFNHGLGASFGTNIILGANFKLGTAGEVFADYSIRNLFKNNQIAVGYRFVF